MKNDSVKCQKNELDSYKIKRFPLSTAVWFSELCYQGKRLRCVINNPVKLWGFLRAGYIISVMFFQPRVYSPLQCSCVVQWAVFVWKTKRLWITTNDIEMSFMQNNKLFKQEIFVQAHFSSPCEFCQVVSFLNLRIDFIEGFYKILQLVLW